jgi:hypothetical protein
LITRQAENETPSSQSAGGPTILRILLGAQLRRLRSDKGISREAAGHSIRGSHAKISRLELGRVSFKERDVADLLTLYGVTDPDARTPLLTLAQHANTPGWWHKYHDLLPNWFENYVGLEEAATAIRSYEVQFIPGLLQTCDYARAVIMLAHGDAPDEELDRRIKLRLRRQQRLTEPNAPSLWVVMDEATLRRPLGGKEAMRRQVEHLLQVTELPNVTIQIVPFDRGGHAAAGGPFTILRFDEAELSDVVYMEQLDSALYLHKREETQRYSKVMDRLCAQADSAAASRRFLRNLLDG